MGAGIAIAAERDDGPDAGVPAGTAPVHANPLRLDPALRPDEALGAVGRACLAHFRHNEPAALAGDAEGVHQMRVALRRLRSAVAVLKGAMPPADRRFLAGEMDRLDGVLAPLRNLDVLLTELLPPVRCAFPAYPDLDHLAAALVWARRAAQERLAEALLSPRHEAAMISLAGRFEHCSRSMPAGPAEKTLGVLLPTLLDRRLRTVRRRGKGFRRQTPRARHRLRIAVKKLRYAIELFGGAPAGDDARMFLRDLRRLQDGLGHASDVRAARALLRRLSAGAAPEDRLARAGERLLAWHKRARAGGERELRRSLRRLRRSAGFWRAPADAPWSVQGEKAFSPRA